MAEPTDDLNREYIEGAGITYGQDGERVRQERIRVMSPLDIKKRVELNIANTTEAMRARVLAETSKSNGHQNAENLNERCLARSPLGGRCTLKFGHFGSHLTPNDYEF